ncbi:MAG: methyltransferase domain-containing protein [Anaerolineales bacterium]|nr:methyltransferase domain-containing protein [Anaerolineales bacterium]
MQLLPPSITVSGGIWADLGCGQGIFTAILHECIGSESEIYAVDKSRRSLAQLDANFRETFPAAMIHTIHTDFTRPLSLPPLDGFVIANAMHFVNDNEKVRVLGDLSGHLKPGGRAIVVEYNASRGNFAVPHPLDENGFLELARRVGLREVSIAARAHSSFMGEMYAGVGKRD